MTTTNRVRVLHFIGVYDADGGPRGELAYVFGKMRGIAHCALCDVTHGSVIRKPAWDRMVARVGVPFILLHRNEISADVRRAIGDEPLAIVLARLDDESLQVALDADSLEALDGDVEKFEQAIITTAEIAGWRFPHPQAVATP